MKIQLLILLGLFLVGIRLNAQTADPQWLISNGKGKSGYTASGNVFNNTITGSFALNGVSAPNKLNVLAKNDLLIIYEDGASNYHTRYMTTTDPFLRSTSISSGTTHSFTPPSPVMYMYLSNRYERDDLPESVSVTNASSGSSLTTSNIPTLSANNSVVPNKDLTLILNLDSVPQSTKYSISYNGIAPYYPRNSPVAFRRDVLVPQPVFDNGGTLGPEYASITASSDFSVPGIVSISNPAGIRYFNFRPTEAANAFMPDANGIRYEVEFSLSNASGVVTTIREPMLWSQDPNFLRVDSIQKVSDGYFIFYHLEFENVGEIATSQLSVRVKFPPFIEVDNVEAFKWFAGNNECTGILHPNGDSIKFEFSNESPLEYCFPADSTRCVGYVEFKAKVKDGNNVMDPDFSLRLFTPQVYFEPSSFPLHEFRDLIRFKDREYFRPINEVDPEGRRLVPDPKPWWEEWGREILVALGLIFLLLLILLFRRRRRAAS